MFIFGACACACLLVCAICCLYVFNVYSLYDSLTILAHDALGFRNATACPRSWSRPSLVCGIVRPWYCFSVVEQTRPWTCSLVASEQHLFGFSVDSLIRVGAD